MYDAWINPEAMPPSPAGTPTRQSYTAPPGERLRFYTPLHGNAFEDAARGALAAKDAPGRAALASFSAAQWLAPYGRTGTHYFFADEEGLHKLQAALKLAPASKGENVVVLVRALPARLYLKAHKRVPSSLTRKYSPPPSAL